MHPGAGARRGSFRPKVVIWLGLGFVVSGALGPALSCAPIEQLVVGGTVGQGGAGGACGLEGEDCTACVSDGADCEAGAACCSGNCSQGKCLALSEECLTAGNACASSAECCSGLCDQQGHCSLASSYCVQPRDVCRAGAECCTGVCEIAEGASLGVCGATPSGASNCAAGVSGLLCTDCNQCCSRLCAPYGESGIDICMPPSGCRVTGEICRNDADCCGGDADSGLPGAGNGACDKEPGAEVGVCRNAMGCSPAGNVCHMMDYACSVSAASNRCCDGSEPGACVLDGAGIPRCGMSAGACGAAGEACASSADCCDSAPCTRDDVGALRCLAQSCAAAGDICTAPSDCCFGLDCDALAGAAAGQCVDGGA